LQVANAGLLLNGDGDRFLVVAEEALEGCWELLLLRNGQQRSEEGREMRAYKDTYPLGALRFARRFALSLRAVSLRMRPGGR
jgi:hypothetical protein